MKSAAAELHSWGDVPVSLTGGVDWITSFRRLPVILRVQQGILLLAVNSGHLTDMSVLGSTRL